MALRLAEHWTWDFWLLKNRADYHLFYLQAPRSLGDERLRHLNAVVGHSFSKDLTHWTELRRALEPGPPGAWDDLATWTGSALMHNGVGYLFYTGLSTAEDGLVQRIGLATSADLLHWTKHHANPLITADRRWYEQLDRTLWHDQAWRDPWVFQDPESGEFNAFITARVKDGPPDGRGAIGLAVSADLEHWEVRPPVAAPGEFGHMEVPQLSCIDGRYYLLFSTAVDATSPRRQQRTGLPPVSGTHYLRGDAPLGPFSFDRDAFLVGEPMGRLYAGKLVQNPAGEWKYLAFHMYAEDGSFTGEVSNPMPVHIDPSGSLTVEI